MTDRWPPATPHPATQTGHRPPLVDGRTADRLSAAVYVVVALVALVGQSLAAVHWLGWPLIPAMAAVSVVELTAIALAARADYRRRKGEPAVAARVLSGLVAAFMTAVNFTGHWLIDQRIAAAFFSAATAVGYLVWLLNSADRRRDQMLAEGRVRQSAPSYGAWQWVRHPLVTRRARALALRDPGLSWHGSLDRATAELRRERRNRALAKALRRRVTSAVDRNTARIAVLTYDMDEIAARLAAGADYDGLTALVAADLAPDRLALPASTTEEETPATEPDPAPAIEGEVVPFSRPSTRSRPRPATRRQVAASTPTVQELAATLCREHCRPGHTVNVGKPTALATLRRVYGSCSGDRAREAKDVHNAGHQASTGDRADNDQESEAAAV